MKLSFDRGSGGDNNVVLDVYLDKKTHQMLLEYCKKNNSDLVTGFFKAAERGMKFFRAVNYKEMKQDYLLLRKQAEEYEKDNEALRRLVEENEKFSKILNTASYESQGKENES